MDEFNSFLDDINLELREFEEEQEFTADWLMTREDISDPFHFL